MKITTLQADLEDQNIALEKEKAKLEKENAKLKALVEYYEEQIRLANHRKYGRSSEQTEGADQLSLFDETENMADKSIPEPTTEQVMPSQKREKRVGKREEDLSKLPQETITYDLPDEEKPCPECGNERHKMSEEVRQEIIIIPAQVKVLNHVTPIYSCRNCEKHNDHTPIAKAEAPAALIPGSVASASLIAHIANEKYVMATPLYRQEQAFAREDIYIPRQNMANWLIMTVTLYLILIYDRMVEFFLQHDNGHADETVLQVLREPGRKANTNSYMWLYRTGGESKTPVVIYEYQQTRSAKHPKTFLANFKGFLHTDGYEGYHNLPDVTVVGCWAHARRKFDEALKAMPEEARQDSLAWVGFDYCNQLFMLEREFSEKNLSSNERYFARIEKSKPVAEEFFKWSSAINALPKSLLGKAITYALNQQQYLMNVFLDGRLELSNNRAERSIKPFVIGRKNWLFSNTKRGAKTSAVIYSIIETAKENGLNPFAYLLFLLKKLPDTPISQIDLLLPWADLVQEHCKAINSKR